MNSAKIKMLYDDYVALSSFFCSQNQISFATCINDVYRKSLLISAASFFEVEICKAIYGAAEKKGKANRAFVNFIENKVIKRQYHTFFAWNSPNTNNFWGLFGEDFKKNIRLEIKERKLEDAESAFLYIGRERNNLVHNDYVNFIINATFEEIYSKYKAACDFVDFIVDTIKEKL